MLNKSQLESYQKKCLTFSGHLLYQYFTTEEFAAALQNTKPGKAQGPDSTCRSCLKVLVTWLPFFLLAPPRNNQSFEKSCFTRDPKASKPREDLNSYRPNSLLCFPFKIRERLIHARVELIIDPLFPGKQAGFRRKRLTVDQAVLLNQNTEDYFEAKRNAGAVFVDLTAANNAT